MKNLFVESLALILLFFVHWFFFLFYYITFEQTPIEDNNFTLLFNNCKPNYKMKVFFSPFGYITWKVNDNWIRNKKMSEHTLRKETGWADKSKNH